jgi:hypothetical protein
MDIWNNPMVNNALKSMTKEQIEEYKKVGEYMYNNVNFEDNKIINNLDPPIEESVAYIEEGIKSGLLPQDLTENEVVVLNKAYGEKWYERYGFVKDDVPEEGLSMHMKKDIEMFVQKKVEEEKNKKMKSKDIRKKRKDDKNKDNK